MTDQLHEDLVALADRAHVPPVDVVRLEARAQSRVRRRQLGVAVAVLLVATTVGVGGWQARPGQDRTQVLASDPVSPGSGPMDRPEPSTAQPDVGSSARDCQSLVSVLDQSVPPKVVSSVVTDAARLRTWNASGRGGLGLPSATGDPETPRNADGLSDKTGTAAPILVCWLEGSFSGISVPPGAVDTFDYAAFLVPTTGEPQLLVASNSRESTLVLPDATSP